jgi:hypothetical protein
MSVEDLKFITSREEGGIVMENGEFMATGCFGSNSRFSMTNPHMWYIGNKSCRAFMI